MLRAIIADDFPPFGKFALELPPVPDKPDGLGEVHLFTGVNGTGKTRLLSLVAAIFGHPSPLALRLKGSASLMRVAVADNEKSPPFPFDVLVGNPGQLVHKGWTLLFYKEGKFKDSRGSDSTLGWLNTVPAFAYHGSPYVVDTEVKTLFVVPPPDRSACLSFDRDSQMSPPFVQAIANLIIQSALDNTNPNSSSDSRGGAARLIRGLESALTQITGHDFKFHLEIKPNVSLRILWESQNLYIDALPDGLRSIIGWMVHALVMMDVWLKGKKDPRESEAVFLLDEIENHLHPAWQRRVLPAFQHLFPKAQILVATHSPFVIASLNHGWIHPLTMTSTCDVKVEKLIQASKGDSYISVVEDIMGVKEWYDVETEKLLADFRSKRDLAYGGDSEAEKQARKLGMEIGARSTELDFMMGKELIQMDRQLAKSAGQK